MFTARKVFSSSLTISATRVELTGTTVDTTCAVQRGRRLGARRAVPADDLRDVARQVDSGCPGSTRSGENARKKSRSTFRPRGFEHRQRDLVGRARIRRRLEDDELTGLQAGGNTPRAP